ncbi:MAG: hypothetical protein ACLFQ7_04870 [Phormidium sp.]
MIRGDEPLISYPSRPSNSLVDNTGIGDRDLPRIYRLKQEFCILKKGFSLQ